MAAFCCPSCGHSQAVNEKYVGRNATCPKCKGSATVVADSPPLAPPPSDSDGPTVHRKTGGPMGIDADMRNHNSKLRREWIILNEPRLPLGFDIAQTQGITTGKTFNGHTFDWFYTNRSCLIVRHEAISAFEIRHLTFDVWGEHRRTLLGSEIADHSVSSLDQRPSRFDFEIKHKWDLYSETEAWDFYASISYVARVRTTAGKVVQADTDAILREARRFSEKFTAEQLEPTPQKR